MWLLDHNLPRQLFETFRDSIGIPVETANNRQWECLENGALVRTAVAAGFTCILTKYLGGKPLPVLSLKDECYSLIDRLDDAKLHAVHALLKSFIG